MQLRGQPPPQKRGLSIGLGAGELFAEPKESVLEQFVSVVRSDAQLPASIREVEWGMLPSVEDVVFLQRSDAIPSVSEPNTEAVPEGLVLLEDEDMISFQLSYPDIWRYAFSYMAEFKFVLLSVDTRIVCKCGIVLPCEVDFVQIAPELFALVAASYWGIQQEVDIHGAERVSQSLFVESVVWQKGAVMMSRIKKAA